MTWNSYKSSTFASVCRIHCSTNPTFNYFTTLQRVKFDPCEANVKYSNLEQYVLSYKLLKCQRFICQVSSSQSRRDTQSTAEPSDEWEPSPEHPCDRCSTCIIVRLHVCVLDLCGTWQEAEDFVSPMPGDRMHSGEVTEPPEGKRPLISTLNSATAEVTALRCTNGAQRSQRRWQEDQFPQR